MQAAAIRFASYLPTAATVKAAAVGTMHGAGIAFGNQQERTVRAGANAIMTALFQTIATASARSLAILAIEVAIKGPSHIIVRITTGVVTFVGPIAVGVLINAEKIDLLARRSLGADHWVVKITTPVAKATSSQRAQKILLTVHNNIGRVAQVVSVVACIALIALGNPVVGGIALAFTLGDIACEYGLVPSRVRRLFNAALPHVYNVMSVFIGHIFNRLVTAVYLIAEIALRVFEHRKRQDVKPSAAVPVDLALAGSAAPLNATVNPSHVNAVYHLNAEPNFDLKVALQGLSDAVDWENPALKESIRKYLEGTPGDPNAGDLEWKKMVIEQKIAIFDKATGQWQAVENTEASRVAYIRWGLEQLGNKIIDKKILDGEPKSYDNLRNLTKQTVLALVKIQPKEEEVTPSERWSYLIDLAAGSYYCGTGINRAVQENHALLCSVQATTLEGKIQGHLGTVRRAIFDEWYQSLATYSPLLQALDPNDIHTYNLVMTAYAGDFGLPLHVGALDDHTPGDSAVQRLQQRIMGTCMGWGVKQLGMDKETQALMERLVNPRQYLWDQYSKDKIILETRLAIRSGQISSADVTEWFQSWIRRELLATSLPAQDYQTAIDTAARAITETRAAGDAEGQATAEAALAEATQQLTDLVGETYLNLADTLIHREAPRYAYLRGGTEFPTCLTDEYSDRALEIMLTEMGMLQLPPRVPA